MTEKKVSKEELYKGDADEAGHDHAHSGHDPTMIMIIMAMTTITGTIITAERC